jgi:hypothetical protein
MVINILPSIIGLGVALWLLPRMDWRSWQARYGLSTYLGVFIVSVLRTPEVALAIDAWVGAPEASRLLQYLTMTGVAMAWSQICLSIAPPEIRRRRWIILLLPLFVAAIVGLWLQGLTDAGHAVSYLDRSNSSIAITVIAQLLLFLVTMGIGFPTTYHCLQVDHNPAARIRLSAAVGMQLATGIMTGAVVGLHLAILLGWLSHSYQSGVVSALVLLTALLYLATALPAGVSLRLALVARRAHRWVQIHQLRTLERQAAALLGQLPKDVNLEDMFRSPDYVLYTLVIAVLDRRKSLEHHHDRRARALGIFIYRVAMSAQHYSGVVHYLQQGSKKSWTQM